jgi:hypothetical protein
MTWFLTKIRQKNDKNCHPKQLAPQPNVAMTYAPDGGIWRRAKMIVAVYR